MSDQIDRDIEEIMNRLDGPARREGAPGRLRRLIRDRVDGLRGSMLSRVARFSPRQVKLASLALALLLGAGLFLGLVYPGSLFAGGDSGDSDVRHGSVAEQAGNGAAVGGAWQDESDDGAPATSARDGQEEADHVPDRHEEGDDGRGEGRGDHAEGHHD